jgi:5-methylcytosine-specific restriction endonuclease McrBC regulatory subunit McrC
VLRLRPDLVFLHPDGATDVGGVRHTGGGQPLLVVDTKYKEVAANRTRSNNREHPDLPVGVSIPGAASNLGAASMSGAAAPADDVYQMLAYLLRLDCPRGLLLYPQLPGRAPVRRLLEIAPPGAKPVQILVATINLRVPIERRQGLVGELKEILGLVAG